MEIECLLKVLEQNSTEQKTTNLLNLGLIILFSLLLFIVPVFFFLFLHRSLDFVSVKAR